MDKKKNLRIPTAFSPTHKFSLEFSVPKSLKEKGKEKSYCMFETKSKCQELQLKAQQAVNSRLVFEKKIVLE